MAESESVHAAARSEASAKAASSPRSGAANGVVASEPLTHTFYIHHIKSSGQYLIYSSNGQDIAYTVNRPRPLVINPFSAAQPELFTYRNRPRESSVGQEHHKDRNHPQSPLIAETTIGKYSGSITISINNRSLDLSSRIRGPWLFARQWHSPIGVTRWQYSKYGSSMELVDSKKEVLGRWKPDTGAAERVCKVWVKAIEGGENKQWLDEVLTVAMANFVAKNKTR
ncbi:MAG: hypothetical protein LQ350_006415 [Teloschistes chrysophthalmus]|nr:MAG: hypothetical protein LQ350_006415 [Niorma chrysophthalma]